MDIIEQAAKRLAELKKAGVDVPAIAADPVAAPVFTPAPVVEATPSANNSTGHMSKRIELDMATLARNGILTAQSGRSQLAEELRVIKRPLLRNVSGKGVAPVHNGNLIMITSAVPSEGKSFSAANLAMSIAMELDHTVLLVDADVARPSLPKIFNLPQSRGLLDLLTDDRTDLSQVLLRTNVDKLSILPSGTPHPQATELLASDAMVRLLDDMASRYSDRIIIFDSPPLLLTTESRVLAAHMGQIVLVVRAERTTHAEVRHALSFLESCPVKMLMLNQAEDRSANGHGYGYGYGYSASQAVDADNDKGSVA